MTEATNAKKKPKKGNGHFFAIDRYEWEQVCNLDGMNMAVTYLVLARGSLKDNITTGWSARAVTERTAISYKRAAQAILKLENFGFLKTLQGEVRQKALKATRGVYGPLFSGALRKGKAPLYRLRRREKFSPIWVPNTLVDGASSEIPPLERVRATSDVGLLRLLIDLYSTQDLSGDGGISRDILHGKTPDESKLDPTSRSVDRLGEYGKHAVWKFRKHQQLQRTANKGPTGGEIFNHHWGESAKYRSEQTLLWDRIGSLEDLGLIEWVQFILNGDTEEGEPLLTWNLDGVETPEAQSAFEAGAALVELMAVNGHAPAEAHCLKKKYGQHQAYSYGNVFVPAPNRWQKMSVIEVARLRYWPNTKKNNAWYSAQKGQSNSLKEHYGKIRAYAFEQAEAVKIRKNQANG